MIQKFVYSLKIDFENQTENPSRIFKSMGALIESFKDLDFIFARSIDANLEFKQVLDSIEVNSLISKIMNELTYDSQTNLGELENSKIVEKYFDDNKKTVLKTINKNNEINKIEIIDKLNEELKEIAYKSGLSKSLKYTEINKLSLIRKLEAITNSVKGLSEKEDASYGIGEDKLPINKKCVVSTNQLQNMLSDEELESEFEITLIIKKPDLLGNSRWEFKHGHRGRTIPAKISDKSWLDKFHEGKIPIVPGDSIKARTKEIIKYDNNGNIQPDYLEIIQVIDVIHKPRNSQIEIFT